MQNRGNGTKSGNNGYLLPAALIASFMTTFMSSALNLSVPSLEHYFGVHASLVSWVVSIYTISVAALSLPFGKLADATGRRRVFLIGVGGFGAVSLVSIFLSNFTMLILLRALQGAFAAMTFATNNALLIDAYPASRRGHVLGLSVAATYVGLSAGPVIGGILENWLGWRSIFACAVLISVAGLIPGLRIEREEGPESAGGKSAARPAGVPGRAEEAGPSGTPGRVEEAGSAGVPGRMEGNGQTGVPGGIPSKKVDVSGVLCYIAAITLSLYGMTSLGSSAMGTGCFVFGILLLVIFFFHEGRAEDPIMKVSMFRRSRTFTFSNLAALLNYGATFAISYMISIYLQVVQGIPSSRAGLILVIMPLMQALLSPKMGTLSDRIRPSVLASTGMGICVVTLLLFSRLREGTGLPYVLAVLALTGVAFALFASPNNNAILATVDREDYGVANSIIATMRTYGQSSGMAILNVVTAAVLGSGTLETSPVSDILYTLHASFLIFAGLCVLGLLFSMARDRLD